MLAENSQLCESFFTKLKDSHFENSRARRTEMQSQNYSDSPIHCSRDWLKEMDYWKEKRLVTPKAKGWQTVKRWVKESLCRDEAQRSPSDPHAAGKY